MKQFLAIVIALASVLQATPPSDTCKQETWITDGPVNAIVSAGDKVYIGGTFTQVGPYTGGGVPINSITGAAVAVFPKIIGQVNAVCADGNGGWFVGGQFTFVDGVARNNIAHILSDGSLDPVWNPDAGSYVRILAVSGATVYAGGDFTSIGGQIRNYIAALDATTGMATAWNPNADYYVQSLAVSGTTVYAGGGFTSIGGQSRNHIAALEVTTGMATAWNPNAGAYVLSLVLSGTTIYAGGSFTSIGGQSRNYIAALDATTGNATGWNPNADNSVAALVVSGTTVYTAGYFTSIGDSSRNRIAALDATTGKATAWNPNASSYVRLLAVSGTTVYAAGEFASIGGQNRKYIAALDATTGNALAWNPNANYYVYSLIVSGTTVYAGGNFSSIGQGVAHPCFAQFGNFYSVPVVQSISPSSGVNNAAIQITNLNGSNFRLGTTVKLVKAGQADINASGMVVISSTQITCTIDITNAVPGAWDVVVTNDDSKSGTLSQGFVVASAPPVLVSPANNTTDLILTPTLTWHKAANDSLYTVQLSASSGFSSFLVNNNLVPDTFFSVSSGVLSNNTPYFWKVCIIKKGGEVTGFSAPWTFTTIMAAPGVPNCLSPSVGAVNVALSTPLIWSKVTGAISYHTQIVTDTGFTSIVKDSAGILDTSYAWTGFANDIHYFWRVNSTNAGGSSQWSSRSDFTTIVAIPSVIALKAPATGDTIKVDSVFLSWCAGTPQVDRYWVEYGTDSSFAATTVDSAVTDTVKLIRSLNDNDVVWWRVKAHNAAGWGDWSAKAVLKVRIPTMARARAIPKTFSFTISGRTGIIRYALPKAEHVSLRLYGVNGQLKSEPVNMQQNAGYYNLNMQRSLVASGSYLVMFKAGEYHQKKMVFLMK